MAFAFSTQANGTKYGTGTLASGSHDISSGDLIIVHIPVVSGSCYCNSVSDTAGNSYTIGTAVFDDINIVNVVTAYCIGATAQVGNVVTAGFASDASVRKSIVVGVYTPDGGETVSLDVTASNGSGWEASPWETGTCNTTGDDEVCAAAFIASSGPTYSNQEIPGGTAATVLTSPDSQMTAFYRILSATQANNYAETDTAASARYAAEMVCFKSVAAGGIAPTGTIYGPLVGPMGGPI